MKLIRESKFFILGLLLPLGAFLFLPSVLLGEETAYPPVVINEIGAYEATDHECVEIFLTSAEPFDLTNWKFYEESTKHGLTLYQGGSAVLAPGEYAIIADEAENFAVKSWVIG